MKVLLKRCSSCNAYTLKDGKCPKCGGALRVAAPPKFSPDDPLLKKRLQARKYLIEGVSDP